MSRRALVAAGASALWPATAFAEQTSPSDAVLPSSLGPSIPPELLAPSRNWPVAQGDLAATRSAVGSSIDSTNVGKLQVIWEFPIEASTGYGGMTATPIVIDDAVYVQDMLSNVFALDRATGRVRWQRRYEIPCTGPNGVAVAYGRIFACAGDTAEVFSLDASTGDELWRVRLSNNPGEGIDMAPAVHDSIVYISTVAGNTHSFNRGGARGILFALDASTGETLWQFDTTTDNLWGNPRVNSGGGLWFPPSFDDAGGIYFGVANAGPWPGTTAYPNGTSRPGANDYASSMVALDRATGAIRWHVNAAPHDLLDHDFQNSPVLVETGDGASKRRLAIGSGKTGTVIAVDRDTGEVIWTTSVGLHDGDEATALPESGVKISPGAWGGVLTPIATDGSLLLIPVVTQHMIYSAKKYDKMSMFNFSEASGVLVALDLQTGALVWNTEVPSPLVGAATIVNDVVVTAGMDGGVRFFDTANGVNLRQFYAQAGVNAAPAVAGEMVLIAAAGPWVPSTDEQQSDEQGAQSTLVALGFTGNS